MSAIRALRQVSLSYSRAFAAHGAARAVSRIALPVFAVRAGPVASRAFSVSARRFGEGASDVALTQKLAEELQYEKESASDAEPEFVRAFKAQGVWEIEDTNGNDEIALRRKFGNEHIRLMFSIADMHNEQEAEFEEGEEGNAEASEDQLIHSYPIRCSVSITKTNTNGAVNIDTLCQEGAFLIDNVSFYGDASVGTDLTAEADWKRRGQYIGPQFDTLDVTVQEEFEQWLKERGVNDNLATFVPEYAEWKEQREYVSWLQEVKKFIEA